MNYYFLAAIAIFLIAFFVIQKQNSNKEKVVEYKVSSPSIQTDSVMDFGYKMVWIAVKTSQKNRLAEIINLKRIRDANWESGIETAYDNGIFITPQIGEWTLIAGTGLPNKGDTKENIVELENLLNALSAEFGEAQFFGTHRVVEFHNWMKSTNGNMERIYSYVGESMESIKVLGVPTKAEEGLELFNSLSEEAKNEAYFEREDLTYADETLVMDIAEKWSVNPTKLSERTDIKDELGLAGK